MVEPYVEALRYLTPLGFDVLTFVIIDRLAGSGARWPRPQCVLPHQTECTRTLYWERHWLRRQTAAHDMSTESWSRVPLWRRP